MKRLGPIAIVTGFALLAMLAAPSGVVADKGGKSLKADLEGFQEVPAVSSTGSGEFRGKISRDESSI